MHSKKLANLLGKGLGLWYPSVHDSIKTARLAVFTYEHVFEGSVVPAIQAAVGMQEQLAGSLVDSIRGDQSYRDFARDTWQRLRSGARYSHLVGTLGKELFGSAKLPGEKVIDADDRFRLVYIPPKDGQVAGPPVFHAGGSIPYGDRIFRLLPEANFYERFTERGLPVYAMEVRGDRYEVDYGKLTMDEHVENLERLIDLAFRHAGRKLVLEGYCGHGMQLLPYLAAKPAHAEQTLCAVALFVSPVHGPACTMISSMPQLTPKRAADLQLWMWDKLSGYVWGDGVRLGLDLALKKNFIKTPFGYFHDGWSQSSFAAVKTVDDLDPLQRKMLAGAYWISAENARRFAIPVDLVRYANAMFSQGLGRKGELPVTYRGRELSLADFAKETTLPVFGFYGGTDPVILDRTGYPFVGLLGKRYHHVVHPYAGHISYIFSPELWDPEGRKAFDPHPIDLLVEAAGDEH
jgi:hypothetical protein